MKAGTISELSAKWDAAWREHKDYGGLVTAITPAGIEDFHIGMWVRRRDQEGRPIGPILVVTGYAGWVHKGEGLNGRGAGEAKWTHNIQRDFREEVYGYNGGLGGIDLSDGTMAYPGELFRGRG